MGLLNPPSKKDNHTDLAGHLQGNNGNSTPSQPSNGQNQQVVASDGQVVTLGQKKAKTK